MNGIELLRHLAPDTRPLFEPSISETIFAPSYFSLCTPAHLSPCRSTANPNTLSFLSVHQFLIQITDDGCLYCVSVISPPESIRTSAHFPRLLVFCCWVTFYLSGVCLLKLSHPLCCYCSPPVLPNMDTFNTSPICHPSFLPFTLCRPLFHSHLLPVIIQHAGLCVNCAASNIPHTQLPPHSWPSLSTS